MKTIAIIVSIVFYCYGAVHGKVFVFSPRVRYESIIKF